MHRWFDPINWQAQLPEAERELGGTLYCVMDYDLSLLHDEALDLNCYFRPVAEAWVGRARYHPDDYSQGEWRYNPFAFDVACLGGMIRSNYAVRALFSRDRPRVSLRLFPGCDCCGPVAGPVARQDDDSRHLRPLHGSGSTTFCQSHH